MKKYCGGKKQREAWRYSQLCHSSTTPRCHAPSQKSLNCWLLKELEGWKQGVLPIFLTPSCCHLLLVSIRDLYVSSVFNNNIWLHLYFEDCPRKSSSCHLGRDPITLNPIQDSEKPVQDFLDLLEWQTYFAYVHIGVPVLTSRSPLM